jgi:peptidoglycan/xylan/chitin deacetylase (PgdA/CDA1 family)
MDDGHASLFSLRESIAAHGIPATVFLCSGFLSQKRRFWFLAPGLSPAQREYLKTIPDGARIDALRAGGFDDSIECGERHSLNVDEVRQLAPLIDFQSHSVSHPILPMCSDNKARDEITFSKDHLQQYCGLSVNAMAYPNGSYTEREIRLTREAGYECGLTMVPGYNDSTTPLFELRRLAMPDDCGIHELVVRSCGLWAFLREGKRVLVELTSKRAGAPVSNFISGSN